jgi:hypothetical protein
MDASPDPGATVEQELRENQSLARLLEETAAILERQGATFFRVRAYRDAARIVAELHEPVRALWRREGRAGLQGLPHIGESLSRAIETWLETGTLGILRRLSGEEAAESVLRSVPGIGAKLARQIHHELHVSSLEDLEAAAHDGRLAGLPRIGPRRLQSIRDQLAARLRRSRSAELRAGPAAPPVAEILDVDREYREQAAAGRLPRIAPRRFNPGREAWLPVLHTERGGHHYTALYSNTARAHELGRTRDWVVVYLDDGAAERQWTVVTESRGPLAGRRVVRGREREHEEQPAAGTGPL